MRLFYCIRLSKLLYFIYTEGGIKMISMIVACDMNNVIGYENKLPWHLPEDMKYFKRMTTGSTVVMGRKTYESIGRPLPNRTNVIVSRGGFTTEDDVIVVSDLKRYLEYAPKESDIFVIGGEEIYKQSLPYAYFIYMTRILKMYSGDVFFPRLDNSWEKKFLSLVETSKNGIDYQHLLYERAK